MNVIGFRASCPFQLGHWDLAGMNSVDDLRVDGTGAALLNLRDIQLEGFVHPVQQLRAADEEGTLHHTDVRRVAHGNDAKRTTVPLEPLNFAGIAGIPDTYQKSTRNKCIKL